MHVLNKAFWITFAATAFASLGTAAGDFFLFGIFMAIFTVLIGLAKLDHDVAKKELHKSFNRIENELHEIMKNFEKGIYYTSKTSDKIEKRIYRIDAKRAELDRKTEKLFRDAVRKIVELENNLNKIRKAMEKTESG